MRSLLVLLAVPIALVGYYYLRLDPIRFELDRLTGVALATIVVILWSAALQISWREKDERPDSPTASPDSPARLTTPYRAIAAGFCVVLAIPVTAYAWHWIQQNAADQVARFCVAADLPVQVRYVSVPVTPPRVATVADQGFLLAEPLDCEFYIRDPAFNPTTYQCLLGRAPQLGRPHPLIAKHQPPRAAPTNESPVRTATDAERYYETSVWDLEPHERSAAMTWAIQRGDVKRVQELIDAGADVNARCSESGRTPLEDAELCGQRKMIDLLKAAGAEPPPDA